MWKQIEDSAIYAYYLGEIPELGKKYISPFRDDGEKPSLSFFESYGKLLWTDFGAVDLRQDVANRTRNAVSFVMQIEGCNEKEANSIIKDIAKESKGIVNIFKNNKDVSKFAMSDKDQAQNTEPSLEILVRKYWRSYEVDYWKNCNLSLINERKIYPIEKYGYGKKFITSEPLSPAFFYDLSVEGEKAYKVYRPKETDQKWKSLNIGNVIEGFLQLPEIRFDNLIITSSMKDSICTMSCIENVFCINPASENIWKAIYSKARDINARSRNVYVWLDADHTGHKNTIEVCKVTGWKPILLPINKRCKDQFEIAAQKGGYYLKEVLKL